MLPSRALAPALCGLLLAVAPVDLTWAQRGAQGGAQRGAPTAIQDGFVRRLQAEAVLQTLRAELLSHDSATAVLQAWCDAHGPGGQKILAEHDPKAARPPSEQARMALGLQGGEAVRYRRVRLACGAVVLSEADNWYLPERLTPEMNRALDSSDAPFGAVVRPLDFRRRFLSSDLLWRPMPDGWETAPPDRSPMGPVPDQVLRDAAVLTLPDGRPFSFVAETYTGAAVEMALPR